MKTKHFKAIFALAAILLASACKPPAETTVATMDQVPDFNILYTAIVDEPYNGNCRDIDEIVEAYLSRNGAPNGMAIGIVRNNAVYYLKGYGLADVAGNIPFTYATPSGVGSISKTITALGILRLVDQGIIDLDAQASEYLPAGSFDEDITVRQLLSHSSGLPMWPNWNSALNTESEFQAVFPIEHPAFIPGLAFWGYRNTSATGLAPGIGIYSNAGYTLLGAIIDYVTTQAVSTVPPYTGVEQYERYTWTNIGAPMDMYSMSLYTYWRTDDILNLSRGYRQNSNNLYTPATNPNGGPGGWRGPAGGWTMTIGDLCRLMIGINTNAVISEERTAEMVDTDIDLVNASTMVPWAEYGMGVFKQQNLGQETVMHAGNIDGYTARYTLWPERNMGIAILCNEEKADGFRDLVNDLARLFLSVRPPCMEIESLANASAEDKAYLENIMGLAKADEQQYRQTAHHFMASLQQTDKGKAMMKALQSGKMETVPGLFHEMIEERRKSGDEPDKGFNSLNEVEEKALK